MEIGLKALADNFHATTIVERQPITPKPEKKAKRWSMSARQRKAHAARMKRVWAEKRAAGTNHRTTQK